MSDQRVKFYEGKAKILYRLPSGRLIHYFKDSATAFNAQKKQEFEGKGALNAKISDFLFRRLTENGVSHHWLGLRSDREAETESLQMLPLEVIVRRVVAGSLAKRWPTFEGQRLSEPVVEFCVKDDALGDPLISEDLLVTLMKVSRLDCERARHLALQVNAVLVSTFDAIGFNLVDFKIEIGRNALGDLVVADEISPDTCRLVDASGSSFDKDLFRFDRGDLLKGYREVWQRLESGVAS